MATGYAYSIAAIDVTSSRTLLVCLEQTYLCLYEITIRIGKLAPGYTVCVLRSYTEMGACQSDLVNTPILSVEHLAVSRKSQEVTAVISRAERLVTQP